MKKLKIGIITHNFPSSISDRQNAGIFVYDFAKAMNKNTEIVVFSPGPADDIRNIGGIKTHFFKFKGKLGDLKIYNPFDLLKFANFFIKGRKALNSFIDKNPDIDFVISMWAYPSGFFANKILKKRNIPYAIYCLGSDIYIYAKKPLLKEFIQAYLKESAFNLADSPDLAAKTDLLSNSKTIFVPSASNISKEIIVRKKNLKTVLTFMGRLEKVKGIDIFIDALKLLNSDANNYQINIIGSGSLENYINSQLTYLDKLSVKIWGNINNPKKISSILIGSDWLVIPSRSDSIPLVFSESMKLSLPVIVSSLPDLKYLVKKYNVGMTFKTGSVNSLASVLKLTSKNENYREYEKNTKKAAEIFDLKIISDKLLRLIKKNL